uniref:J domain-containing protein n=1 Tax=Haptolina ericina TaxID=156174 RepID=A0A7S3BEI8_9EUKA|mmetsp:Transcript_55879/g.124787  ORF Transcript_55879/g.124787 Transcript_55879/m.124787 type:complete len:228 (+) Transcript_55879:3-686(+)
MGGGMGGNDLFDLAAPAPLAPQVSSMPRHVSASVGMQPPLAANRGRHSHSVDSGLDNLMGFDSGVSKPLARAPYATTSMEPDPFADPNEPAERRQLRLQKEAEKQAAINEKVDTLRAQQELIENNRERERDLEKTLKLRVQQWQKEKKNLRALLASLHEIAPKGEVEWKPMSLAELIDPSAVKKGYRKAILATHPDKRDPADIEAKVLAQLVFDALRDAWNAFQQSK